MTAPGVRVGVDVGGTFTDLVAWDATGRMSSLKVPTTPANPAGGVLNGLAAVARAVGHCASLAHGTTLVTNAIIERRVGRELVTVEGLEAGGQLDPLQIAFAELGAAQCGFCTPGMLLSAKALLAEHPGPTADDVREALSGNLCRCTGYTKIVEAVLEAASRR